MKCKACDWTMTLKPVLTKEDEKEFKCNCPPLKHNQRILKMFGEYACLHYDNERDEAKSYLHMWKKYLLRRLQRESYNVKVIDEQWGERPSGSFMQSIDIYLKIVVEFEWRYDDHLSKLEGIEINEGDLK